MSETALAAAFKRASAPFTAFNSLYTIACNLLRKVMRNPYTAHESFCEAVLKDRHLIVALVTEARIRELAMAYLQKTAQDMSPDMARKLDAGVGHQYSDAHVVDAPPASAPLPGKGCSSFVAHRSDAQPRQPEREDGGQAKGDILMNPATVPRGPSEASINARQEVANVVALNILTTYRLQNGMTYGNVRYGDLDGMVETLERKGTAYRRDAALLRLTKQAIDERGAADASMKIADLISAGTAARLKQQSAEATDA